MCLRLQNEILSHFLLRNIFFYYIEENLTISSYFIKDEKINMSIKSCALNCTLNSWFKIMTLTFKVETATRR
jgi:hypothetical protein